MRSYVPMPAGTRMFPQLLREAGYYCSNNSKEDYNLEAPGKVWDESSPHAHWNKRPPGQPFFAVFNYTETHESQTRKRPHAFVHDPARAPIPPYMPDTTEAREGWAQYYDQITVVDGRVGAALHELREAGLAEDTIVFFYGDHGAGLPRNKRSACDSGLRVPLLVHFPEKWRHLAPADYAVGGESQRLVGFVDLAPTVLSLAGVKPPSWMHGRAFAGPHAAQTGGFLFGGRGRMDERIDLVRAVTDGRFVYVRNYLPHRPHGQHVAYLFETPMTVAWKRRFDAGDLPAVQRAYWEPKEPVELYDLESDPFETVNLAADPAHRATLVRLRDVLRDHVLTVGDAGLLPEAEMLRLAAGRAPGDLPVARPGAELRRLFAAAELASGRDPEAVVGLEDLTRSGDAGVRYWGAVGFMIRGPVAVAASRGFLRRLLEDESPSVRVAAAEALAAHGSGEDARAGLDALVRLADASRNPYFVAVASLNALDNLGAQASTRRAELAAFPTRVPGVNARTDDYLERLLKHLLGERGP